MTTEKKTDTAQLALKKWRRRALIAGILLGLVCKMLPHDYQVPCAAIAKFCTLGG